MDLDRREQAEEVVSGGAVGRALVLGLDLEREQVAFAVHKQAEAASAANVPTELHAPGPLLIWFGRSAHCMPAATKAGSCVQVV